MFRNDLTPRKIKTFFSSLLINATVLENMNLASLRTCALHVLRGLQKNPKLRSNHC